MVRGSHQATYQESGFHILQTVADLDQTCESLMNSETWTDTALLEPLSIQYSMHVAGCLARNGLRVDFLLQGVGEKGVSKYRYMQRSSVYYYAAVLG